MIVCTDRNGSCRKNICECDKRLVERLTQLSGKAFQLDRINKKVYLTFKPNGTRVIIKALGTSTAMKNVKEVEGTRFLNSILRYRAVVRIKLVFIIFFISCLLQAAD